MYSVDVKKLKKAMIDADVDNIVDFETKSGITRNTLANVLSGEYPSTQVMLKMAMTLKLTTEQCGEIFFATNLTPRVSSESNE